jgi:hypothetical protein
LVKPSGSFVVPRKGNLEKNTSCPLKITLCDTPSFGQPTCEQVVDLASAPVYGAKLLHRKEVIQPQVPLRLPCYDFIPITSPALGRCLPKVSSHTSGRTGFHDVTGGVYKARERIHGVVADTPLLAIPTSWGRVADPNPNWAWL